jgi:two-component system OmpR family sensor kinase
VIDLIDPGLGAAQRRIRRIRWTATLVFAVTTAACLSVLVMIALRVDSSARVTAFDTGLRQQVGSLSELVSFDDGNLDLGRLDASQVERTTPVLGVVTADSIAYAEPSQDALPTDGELRSLLAAQQTSPGVVGAVARQDSGATIHWAVAPVTNAAAIGKGPTIGAIVVVGGPVPGAAAHDALRTRLLVTAAALVIVASLLGHVISGLAMRPAVRGLAAQERFLVDAAHELRTPLSVLQVAVDQAARHPDDLEAQATATARVRRQVQRLATLTDGLLLRARAAVGTADLSLEPLRLDQLVEQVVAEQVETGLAEEGDVVVRAEPVVVRGNPEVLGQGVRNLVENALRHGRPPVLVEVLPGVVRVSDDGPGIAPRDRRRALQAGTTGGDGTGTGLPIAVWAARVHGGSLTLGTAESGGLVATLALAPPRRPHRLLMRRAQDSSV